MDGSVQHGNRADNLLAALRWVSRQVSEIQISAFKSIREENKMTQNDGENVNVLHLKELKYESLFELKHLKKPKLRLKLKH